MTDRDPNPLASLGLGYKSFVAWRYLLVFHQRVTARTKVALASLASLRLSMWLGFGAGISAHDLADPAHVVALAATAAFVVVVAWGVLRHSKPALITFLFGAVVALGATIATYVVSSDQPASVFAQAAADHKLLLKVLNGAQIGGAVLAGLAAFFGALRAIFTFFTTVPIGGVWIGTAALVCVLSVMSGFESDLRDKILGSNAHIQITREDGELLDWREVKAKIDKIPGVVASTPYAVSEVVIAANNNGMNVIIKGIDPESVGRVTNLVANLEDPDAMGRLAPLSDGIPGRTVPQAPPPSGDVLDPPPDDLPRGGDPIDFSGEAAGQGSTGEGADEAEAPDPDDAPYGGDAAALVPPKPAADVVDPPPADLLTSDDPPIDYSGEAAALERAISVIDIPIEPVLSRRTQALPGVLVGRELVKQTHLYTGEEVRIVSPLSDPANPDATGTPIPFNRDFRVAGVFFTGMYEYDLKYVYVTLDALQSFLDRGDAVDGIEVRIEDADDTERYVPSAARAGLIREALGPGYRIQDWRELNRSLFAALKLEKIAMFLVLGIVILVASFSIVGNLIMVVHEKARQIALLKTLGASNVGIMQLFAIQGLMIGVIGTVLGVLTGLLACWAGKKFGLPLNPDVYYIDRLPIHVDPQSVAAAAAAGVLISIMATLYPALLAARVRPAAGMRH